MVLRAKYYGPNDLGNALSLNRALELIGTVEKGTSSEEHDINRILEYYNVTLLFDNKIYLTTWDTDAIKQYSSTANSLKPVIAQYLHSLRSYELISQYSVVDNQLKDDFFSVITEFNVYKHISGPQFASLISEFPESMRYILQNKPLVKQFGKLIAFQLESNVQCTELLLDKYYVSHSTESKQDIFIPAEFDAASKLNLILSKYIEWPEANMNYLQLISRLKKTEGYPVTDVVRYKAKKRVDEFWSNHFSSNQDVFEITVGVSFKEQDDVIAEKTDPVTHMPELSYSSQWISHNLDFPTLFNNFIYLFNYVDPHYRCKFLSNANYLSIVERMMGIHGRKEYITGIGYQSIKMLSNLQMEAYMKVLKDNDIEIEQLFKWFFEEYLKTEFGAEGFTYHIPSANASVLEKNLLLTSQLDGVIKQFRLFVENGELDRKLFEFSSTASKIVEVPSMLENKYLYAASTEVETALHLLFSDQSHLTYTEKTKSKYSTFAEILVHEDIRKSDYHDFNQPSLDWLIKRGIIQEDDNGCLRITRTMHSIMYDLNENGCIAYAYCRGDEKTIVDKMLENNYLTASSSLFTQSEKDYLDYMLNTQQFGNGPEIRNMYAHGIFPSSPVKLKNDYVELLKIMTLIVLKINEEFCLKHPDSDSLISMK